MPRLINLRKELPPVENYVRIDRFTMWGNPFRIGIHGTREEVIEKHRLWVPTQKKLMNSLHLLKGKDLGCWCWPKQCHGFTYFELLGQEVERDPDF